MSALESALVTLVQSNINWYFNKRSVFLEATKSPLAASAVGQFAKIYSAAKSNPSLRFALDLTEITATKIYNMSVTENGSGEAPQGRKDTHSSFVMTELISAVCPELRDKIERDDFFYCGMKMVEKFITKNTPERFQECELVKLVIATLEGTSEKEGNDAPKGNSKPQTVCDIAHNLLALAEEKIAETANEACLCTPSKFLHATIEGTQTLHSSLTSQLATASNFFSNLTTSAADEARTLANIFTKTSENAVTSITEAVKGAPLQLVSMEMAQSLSEFVKISAEGIELFSEYFWTSKPSLWDSAWELPEVNYVIIEDEDLPFVVNQRVQRRKPILYIGVR